MLQPNSPPYIPPRSIPLLQNYTSTNLLKWRRALSRVRAGTANAYLARIGDSTTAGATATGTTNQNRANSSSIRLAELFGSNARSSFGTGTSVASPATWDARCVVSGAAGVTFGQKALGGWMVFMNGAGTYGFTPVGTFDTVDIYYLGGSASGQVGTATVNVNGGATLATIDVAVGTNTTPVGGGARGIQKQTISLGGSLTDPAILITRATGSLSIAGFDVYNAGTHCVHVLEGGFGGSTSTAWNVQANWYDILNSAASFSADLYEVNLGINDWLNAGATENLIATAVATYTTNLTAIVTTLKTVGDVIVVTPYWTQDAAYSAGVSAPATTQARFVAAAIGVAKALGVPYRDNSSRFVSYASMNTLGMQGDVNHPNRLGYADEAQGCYQALISA